MVAHRSLDVSILDLTCVLQRPSNRCLCRCLTGKATWGKMITSLPTHPGIARLIDHHEGMTRWAWRVACRSWPVGQREVPEVRVISKNTVVRPWSPASADHYVNGAPRRARSVPACAGSGSQ